MITYRLRGLVNLHVFVATAVVVGFFWALAALAQHSWIVWFDLSPDVNLVPCVLAIILGMLYSVRFLSAISGRIHGPSWPDAAGIATRQLVLVTLMLFTLIVATKDRSISRIFLANFLLLTWVVLILTNRLMPRLLGGIVFNRRNRLPTLFLGRRETLERLDSWVAEKLHLGMVPVGFLCDDPAESVSRSAGKFLGPTQELIPIIEERKIAQVILLDVPANREEMARIVESCQNAGCRLLIYDNIAARLPIPMIPVIEAGHYFFTAQQEPLEDPSNRMIKRTFDIVISLPVVVLVLPPLCGWVWIMQRLQAPGPLFFVRPRGGPQRTEFDMLKFRSMRHENPHAGDEARQATADDDRVYNFGRFLRKTSLDEVPQFWNVLRGEMSVVGPRPHLPQHDHEFSQVAKAYRTRFLVKPGITGLAQIRGFRGEITDPLLLRQRIREDLIYITGWSIWLDLQITVQTARQVLFPPKTAY